MRPEISEITIEGKVYVPKESETPKPTGTRAVLVIDRGWIVAGDLTEANGRIRLARAVHVLSWQQNGFTGMVEDPKAAGANLKPCKRDFDLPADAEIFRVAVEDSWGP